MPYKDYEKQKARARELYYEKRYGCSAPSAILKPKLTDEERVEARKLYFKEYSKRPETIERRRHNELKRIYGITWEQKVQMYYDQNKLCGLCFLPLDENIGINCVDHCHTTGKVRKLVHKACNIIIGYFENNKSRIDNLIEYLK